MWLEFVFFIIITSERIRERGALEEALVGLGRLEQDFKHIHGCLGHVVEWWRGVKEKLDGMEQEIRHHGISTYMDDAILNPLQNDWSDVEKKYRMYQSEVRRGLH